jgi:hypothetical protein
LRSKRGNLNSYIRYTFGIARCVWGKHDRFLQDKKICPYPAAEIDPAYPVFFVSLPFLCGKCIWVFYCSLYVCSKKNLLAAKDGINNEKNDHSQDCSGRDGHHPREGDIPGRR